MTHICVSKLTIIDSDNELSPGRRQVIIWTNIVNSNRRNNIKWNFKRNSCISFKTMRLLILSDKWWQFSLGLNGLTNVCRRSCTIAWHGHTFVFMFLWPFAFAISEFCHSMVWNWYKNANHACQYTVWFAAQLRSNAIAKTHLSGFNIGQGTSGSNICVWCNRSFSYNKSIIMMMGPVQITPVDVHFRYQ